MKIPMEFTGISALRQALKLSFICLMVLLLSCSDKSSLNNSSSNNSDISNLFTDDLIILDTSQYYDYNDEFIFIEQIWDSSKYYSVKLCDCMVKEITRSGYPVNDILEKYDRAMPIVHGVSSSEVVFCTYLREWGGVYNRRLIDSIVENYILVKDNAVTELIEYYKTQYGNLKTIDIATQYELNCKITAPYTRMSLNLDIEKIGQYVCLMKDTFLDYCIDFVKNNIQYWYYDEDIEVFNAYLDKNCN